MDETLRNNFDRDLKKIKAARNITAALKNNREVEAALMQQLEMYQDDDLVMTAPEGCALRVTTYGSTVFLGKYHDEQTPHGWGYTENLHEEPILDAHVFDAKRVEFRDGMLDPIAISLEGTRFCVLTPTATLALVEGGLE